MATTMLKTILALLLAVGLLIAAAGADIAKAAEVELSARAAPGPLAALPSKPGPHIEKIKALGDVTVHGLGP